MSRVETRGGMRAHATTTRKGYERLQLDFVTVSRERSSDREPLRCHAHGSRSLDDTRHEATVRGRLATWIAMSAESGGHLARLGRILFYYMKMLLTDSEPRPPCAATRPQSLPGAESLPPAPLSSLTPDHQLREDFTVLAKDLVASLKGVVATLSRERARVRSEGEAPPLVASLRSDLSTALHLNSGETTRHSQSLCSHRPERWSSDLTRYLKTYHSLVSDTSPELGDASSIVKHCQ
ncbi:putative Oxysterol-binding protein 3 [Danaus plexippus plexippus]|uniref:Oxysterol-binding protein 3 n=1 Tax=Danaus plexippus plexippus TaxID=278856 RepID=A0A212FPX9_DANPL|nr:putative Oxysterol-binding protein 3 [Danaus plexippus plexippus]